MKLNHNPRNIELSRLERLVRSSQSNCQFMPVTTLDHVTHPFLEHLQGR